MHAVYFVRPGENEELRYSLRSVQQNTDIDYVTIIGDMPDWAAPDAFVQGNFGTEKYPNVLNNLGTALSLYQDDFIIFNDDFYVLSPMENLPLYYRQSLFNHTMGMDVRYPEGRLRRTMINKLDVYLRKHFDMVGNSFEVHVPFPVNGSMLEALMDDYWDAVSPGDEEPLAWRSLYGNLSSAPTEFRNDVLYHGPTDFGEAKDFASTSDRSVEPILPELAKRFSVPSRWEK